MPRTYGTRATSGSRHSREMSVLGKEGCVRVWPGAGGLPLVIQPLQPVPEDAVAAQKCVRRASGRDKTEPGPLWIARG